MTYTDKRKHLIQPSSSELDRLLSVGGFRVKFSDGMTENGGCAFSIPTGFVIHGGVRQLLVSQVGFRASSRTWVKQSMWNICDSFPDIKANLGTEFAKLLDCRV